MYRKPLGLNTFILYGFLDFHILESTHVYYLNIT